MTAKWSAPQGNIAGDKAPATAGTARGCGRLVGVDMSDVTWLSVPGASGYEVSSDGRLRSIDRYVEYKDGRKPRFWPGRQLRPPTHPQGYLAITFTTDNGRRTRRVHQLVCAAFHGPAPSPTHEVRHLNGVKTDNRAENLRWGTRSENSFDTVLHGGNKWANKTHCPEGHEYGAPEKKSDGTSHRVCGICQKEAYKRYHARNKEYRSATRKKYRERNKEYLKAKGREYYRKNREAIREKRSQRRLEDADDVA